ncbi:MAG: ABC transporter ATP-binding protein/permease [Gemmatimonadota bacterium]|nr:ABC transporter ATP-binding protein/permease [Gemmatimonadota bacterium]
MNTVIEVFRLLDTRQRVVLFGLLAMMLVGSVLEIVGVGIILPFVQSVQDPQSLLAAPLVGPALERLGVEGTEVVLVAGATLVVIILLKNGYLAVMWHLTYRFLMDAAQALSVRLMRGYVRAPYERHFGRSTSELIRNTTIEAEKVFSSVVLPMMRLFTELLVTVGLITLLWVVQGGLVFLGIALLAAVSGLIGWRLKSRLKRISEARHEYDARRISWVQNSFGGLKEAKVTGTESFFLGGFEKSNQQVMTAYRELLMVQVLPPLAIEAIAVGVIVSLISVLLVTGTPGDQAFAGIALLTVAMLRLIPSANRMLSALNRLRFNGPSVRTVAAELEQVEAREPDPEAGLSLPRGVITVDSVSYRYPGADTDALVMASLSIEPGQVVALVGQSGAGKSTMVDILLGLLEPNLGTVSVGGVPIRGALEEWRCRIGFIPQAGYLADDSVRRNVAFGIPDTSIDDERVWRALGSAQVADLFRENPEGLDARLGESGVMLSGGQRQRLGIARALYRNPEILILDEATSAVDTETEREIASSIARLIGDRTLIVIAHRLATIRNCDRIFVFDGGRVVGGGTFDELSSESAVFRRLLKAGDAEIRFATASAETA